MKKLLKTFLAGIFDYAGLFPPASLELEEAMAEYIRWRHSDYDWLVSRFVISHNQLEDLYDISARETDLPDPLRLSITAPAAQSILEYLDQLEYIKANIYDIHKSLTVKLKTDVLEIKLPPEVLEPGNEDKLPFLFAKTAEIMAGNHLLPEMVFFEIPGFDFSEENAQNVISALQTHIKTIENSDYEFYRFSGFKIRCGGVQAFQFPPVQYLAKAISLATSLKIPVKFTAGLHHPIRQYHESVKTDMYGFLNVFAASFISAIHNPDENILVEILSEKDPNVFKFTDDKFSYKNYTIPLKTIKELRQQRITTIGSCSIQEPVDDLLALALLP